MLGRRGRDDGSTSAIGLGVAAGVFASAFLIAQLLVAQGPAMDVRASSLDSQARTALDLVVGQSGRTGAGGEWAQAPDDMSRFGLASGSHPNFIDYLKVKALRNGTMETAANNAPDYEDVKAALGLGELDFHLRSYPVLPGLEDPRWTREQSGRLAYLARFSGANAPVNVSASASASADGLNVSVMLRNDATADAVYVVAVSLAQSASGGEIVTEERHTRLMAPGETQTVWVEFPRLAEWDEGIAGVRIGITDPYGSAAVDLSGTRVGPLWLAQTPPEGGSGAMGLLVHAAKPYYVSGDTVSFVADHYDGEGDHLNQDQAAVFTLFGPDGREWVNTSVTLPKQPNAEYTYACSNCTSAGNYTAVLWDSALTRVTSDVVHVSAAEMFTEKSTLDPIAIKEIQIVSTLAATFNTTNYDPVSAPEGDVFGDDSNGPSELIDVLPRYTTLVIGSEVSQTALTPAATKHAIAEWVQAGGNLLVLGTHSQESRWLEPIYHAAQTTANGGISAPDPTHPILTAPNRLQYERYLDRARAWDVDVDAPFTHVLTRGQTGMSHQDTLTVSHPGAYNDGTVVLTSYIPGSLTSPQDDEEARRLMHNLMSQSHTMLFIDYGPPVPEGVSVGSAQRLVAVPHPNVPGAIVEVRLVMYVFG